MPRPQSEAQFQAEMDARNLIESEAIKADPKRMGKAKVAARKVATDAAKAATQAKKVASSKPKSSPKGRKR